jgi:hypothetical protein
MLGGIPAQSPAQIDGPTISKFLDGFTCDGIKREKVVHNPGKQALLVSVRPKRESMTRAGKVCAGCDLGPFQPRIELPTYLAIGRIQSNDLQAGRIAIKSSVDDERIGRLDRRVAQTVVMLDLPGLPAFAR